MSFLVQSIENENGTALVIALLVLVILSLVGISATTTTSIDLQTAANDEFSKIAFYNAESGAYATPKLISKTIENVGLVTGGDLGNISYIDRPGGDTTDFYRQVFGFDTYDGGTLDIEYTLGTYTVQVDAERTGEQTLAGGGAEFASGAEGVGVGSTGGVALFFDVTSNGEGPSTATSGIVAGYRKVTGVPGGL